MLVQALLPLGGALLTVASCYALGALAIRHLGVRLQPYEDQALAFLLGAACLHLVIFLFLALKTAYAPVLFGVLLIPICLWAWRRQWPSFEILPRPLAALAVLFLPFVLLGLFHAWAPETSPDGSGYHLGVVASYIRSHGFEPITTNMFASLSEGVEVLFIPAFMIGGPSSAALVHFTFAIALALAMFAYGRRLGKPWIGAASAFLVFASPVVGIDGSSAYNDVALAAVAFGAFYWLEIWEETGQNALLIPAGLLCGYAYAVKYTGFVMVPLALLWVAYVKLGWKAPALVMACSLTMIAPWTIKDWIYTGNPVSPLGNRIFRNPYVHVVAEEILNRNMRRYEVTNKWALPLEATVRGEKTAGLTGPAFLLAPLGLLALRDRAGRRLLAVGTLFLATYFANVGTRFLIPCLPFFSLALAIPLASFPPLLAGLMLFHAVASWPAVLNLYSPDSWHLERMLYQEALRIVPEDEYLRRNFPPYNVAQLIDANVPAGERVLAMSAVADVYTSHEILVSYQGAFNQNLADSVEMGWQEASQPRVLETFSFPEDTVQGIRLLQTGAGKPPQEQWSIHELRFFHRGVELARSPQWRIQAWPNPWDAWLAFDGSAATRWRTWETAQPGMRLGVEFARPECLDEVRIETSYDYTLHQKAVVEAEQNGKWSALPGAPVISVLHPGPNIRRAATQSLEARGLHYLLMQDRDFGAAEMRADPEGWGLQPVAAGYGAALYRVVP